MTKDKQIEILLEALENLVGFVDDEGEWGHIEHFKKAYKAIDIVKKEAKNV